MYVSVYACGILCIERRKCSKDKEKKRKTKACSYKLENSKQRVRAISTTYCFILLFFSLSLLFLKCFGWLEDRRKEEKETKKKKVCCLSLIYLSKVINLKLT